MKGAENLALSFDGELAIRAPSPRKDIREPLPKSQQAQLGQYMTPATIASFMANMFEGTLPASVRLLDAGAGCGALTTAFITRWKNEGGKRLDAHAYEFDGEVAPDLQDNLKTLQEDDRVTTKLILGDFIENAVTMLRLQQGPRYTHAIINPPYKKINSGSRHRELLRLIGLETVHLYTGFVGLCLDLLELGGQLVAIIPRSFCNGPYYKPFRAFMLRRAAIRHVHLFESRNKAFKKDAVLQENVIISLERGAVQGDITISSSTDDSFEDYREQKYRFGQIVFSDDPESFIHIPTEELGEEFSGLGNFRFSLADIGVNVSTGPVVDFRLRDWLRPMPERGTVPLLYSGHFTATGVEWPIATMKKPNAIHRNAETEKWLYPTGFYAVVRRFSSKEERRRIVSAVIDPKRLPGEVLGFENHLNVFHQGRRPLPEYVARGLSVFLNSTAVDKYFRRFNGHTQVNATDLKLMKYPNRETLIQLGIWAKEHSSLTQETIDHKIRTIAMTHPYIDAAIDILKQLGFPRAQLNERSALVLLAVLDLTPTRKWADASNPLMGITPIMDWLSKHYSKQYAPNTRETVRRQTMHQFMQAGLVLYNPDDPGRPVNSPRAVYQVSPEALTLVRTYGSPTWSAQLAAYMSEQEGLAARYAQERDLQRIPVTIADGKTIQISPGEHSLLIKAIIEEFAPRFVQSGILIYAGDTGEKMGYFDRALLKRLGVEVDSHGKMPDVVIYYPDKHWLLLVESVTSHGPVDGKRHEELMKLFDGSDPGLVYVTAFPSRSVMARYLSEIAWETEVWVADAPSHLIHFNGVRFLGPYPVRK